MRILLLCAAATAALTTSLPARAEAPTDQGKIACAAKFGYLWNAKKRRYEVPKDGMDSWKKCVTAAGSFMD